MQSGHRRTTATHESEACWGTGGTGGNTAAVELLKVSKTSFCKSSHLYLKEPILGPYGLPSPSGTSTTAQSVCQHRSVCAAHSGL